MRFCASSAVVLAENPAPSAIHEYAAVMCSYYSDVSSCRGAASKQQSWIAVPREDHQGLTSLTVSPVTLSALAPGNLLLSPGAVSRAQFQTLSRLRCPCTRDTAPKAGRYRVLFLLNINLSTIHNVSLQTPTKAASESLLALRQGRQSFMTLHPNTSGLC